MFSKKGNAKIGRMAVLKNIAAGSREGSVKKGTGAARKRRAKLIYLNAQFRLVGFYERMGFRCVACVFMEAGIPHRKMVLGR